MVELTTYRHEKNFERFNINNKIASRFYTTPARNALACEAGGRLRRSKKGSSYTIKLTLKTQIDIG
jgi:hypothetical protein